MQGDLFENSHAIMLIVDPDTGNIVEANAAACGFYGYQREELEGMPIGQINMLSREQVFAAMAETSLEKAKHFEFKHRLASGEIRDVEVYSGRISVGGKTLLHSIILDVTERKQVEEELLRATLLESIGVLAGGIAHDFNNFLTIILGNVSLAKLQLSTEDNLYRKLAEVEAAAYLAKDLTQQLLTFAKGGQPNKQMINLAQAISELVPFALSGSNVSCNVELQPELYTVEVDIGQISQVINNMVINAKQAMPDGGHLEVKAYNFSMTAEGDAGIPLPLGEYVKVVISDQGMGIEQENLSKVFDPYFTTKAEGNGLGLAMSYAIIKKHGGHIRVESCVNQGTSFYIYLPAVAEQPAPAQFEPPGQFFGHGKVLVMDDEASIRQMAGDMLNYFGYEVEFAVEGKEALTKYKSALQAGKPFRAVIMDLTIPGGMGGREAVKEILAVDPKVKAIVSSGYTTDPVLADYKCYGFSGFVSKPYKANELGKVLKSILGNK